LDRYLYRWGQTEELEQMDLTGIGTVAGAIVTGFAVGVTVWQYFSQKRQRKYERAQELLRKFDDDPVVRFAVTCVDWGEGLIPVPNDWRVAMFNHLESIWLNVKVKSIISDDLEPIRWLADQLYHWQYASSYDPKTFFMEAATRWYLNKEPAALCRAALKREIAPACEDHCS